MKKLEKIIEEYISYSIDDNEKKKEKWFKMLTEVENLTKYEDITEQIYAYLHNGFIEKKFKNIKIWNEMIYRYPSRKYIDIFIDMVKLNDLESISNLYYIDLIDNLDNLLIEYSDDKNVVKKIFAGLIEVIEKNNSLWGYSEFEKVFEMIYNQIETLYEVDVQYTRKVLVFLKKQCNSENGDCSELANKFLMAMDWDWNDRDELFGEEELPEVYKGLLTILKEIERV